MSNFAFNLRDRVKDEVTGFEGTITARYDFITGINRYYLESDVTVVNPRVSTGTFDESRLVLI